MCIILSDTFVWYANIQFFEDGTKRFHMLHASCILLGSRKKRRKKISDLEFCYTVLTWAKSGVAML